MANALHRAVKEISDFVMKKKQDIYYEFVRFDNAIDPYAIHTA